MTIDIWATTIGDVRFLRVLLDSYQRNTFPIGASTYLRLMVDIEAPYDRTEFVQWSKKQSVDLVLLKTNKGLHHLWNQCVERSKAADICVVMNDDVYLTNGWLRAIQQVLSRNSHVALCGIPCDDGEFRKQPHIAERWFAGDRSLFLADDFASHRAEPARIEPWTSGFLWACKPAIWLAAGGVSEELWWAAGEASMGQNLWNAGQYVASIYYPCVFHFGGGSFGEAVSGRVGQHNSGDADTMQRLFGTGHQHHLLEPWKERIAQSQPPPLLYDPEVYKPQ